MPADHAMTCLITGVVLAVLPGCKTTTQTPPARQVAAELDAPVEKPQTTTAPASIEPGTYRFSAVVKSRHMAGGSRRRLINGAFRTDRGPFVFVGRDQRWILTLEIREIQDPAWFLEVGKCACFVVHSPTHVFREKKVHIPFGQLRDFTLEVAESRRRGVRFSTLRAKLPEGR